LEQSSASRSCTTLSPRRIRKSQWANLLSHKEVSFRAEERKMGG
jgi:hypothetical protein